jgi:hypothetical protein
MRPASRIRRRVRSPCRVTSSHVSLITRSPASSRSASLAASRSRSRRVLWNLKPSSWTARRSFGQKASTSWVAPGAVKELCRCLEVEQSQPLGTVDGNRQFVRLNDSTEIEEGSSRGGYWDAVVQSEVLGSRHAGPVHPHAGWATPPGDHYHLYVRCIRAEPPHVPRRAVAEPGPGPAGHHGREIPTARRNLRHPDGIDAAVHAVQQARANAPVDRRSVPAQRPQLPDRDHAVLPRGQLRNGLSRTRCVILISVCAIRITHPARVAPGA